MDTFSVKSVVDFLMLNCGEDSGDSLAGCWTEYYVVVSPKTVLSAGSKKQLRLDLEAYLQNISDSQPSCTTAAIVTGKQIGRAHV